MSSKPYTPRKHGSTEIALELLSGLTTQLTETSDWNSLLSLVYKVTSNAYQRRPTSALLVNTIRLILRNLKDLYEKGENVDNAVRKLLAIIEEQKRFTIESTERLSDIGARRLPDNSRILVHSYSTSVNKIILKAHEQGKVREVIATESRPGSEGFLTAEHLDSRGVPVTLIVDSAVNYVMDRVDVVLLGSEAITANGALVNKVGSSLISLIAFQKRKRTLVAAGTYKFSYETLLGELIKIPTAGPETLMLPEELMSKGLKTYLPLMDVTPPQYIDAIISEKGVTSPQGVPIMLWEIYGHWPHVEPDINTLLKEMKSLAESRTL